MRSIAILRRLSIVTLALLVPIGTAGAAETASPSSRSGSQEPAEEIEVRGRRALIQLRAEIINLESRMYDLFNQLNDERQFDVICSEEIAKASRIPERECSPLYMRRARMMQAQRFVLFDLTPPNFDPARGPPRNGPSKSINTRGAPMSEAELWFHNDDKHRAFNAKFRELAAQHPELHNITRDWQDKQLRLVELEEEQRKNSLLGRFFSKFSRKDDD